MWHQIWRRITEIGITPDGIFIVVTLGLLELIIFGVSHFLGRREVEKQTELLEDIATTLSIKEIKD